MIAPSRQSGLSSAEVIVMATIMSVLMIMVTESISTLTGVRADQRAQFRLGDVADRVARRIEADVDVAGRIFTDCAIDIDYLQGMDTPVALTSPTYRMPKLTANGYFEPDKVASPETGNVLFVARRGPRVEVKYDATDNYHVQTLLFSVSAPVDRGGVLDLMRWNSELVVDYWDVIEISDLAARADVLVQLHDAGVRYAWDATSPRASGLFEVTPSGSLVQLAAGKAVSGAEDPTLSQPFRAVHLQIARNGVTGQHTVPVYATAVGTFPGGFELKYDGAAAGKLVLLRMVTRSDPDLQHQVTGEILRFFSARG